MKNNIFIIITFVIMLFITNNIKGQIKYKVSFSSEYNLSNIQLEDGNTYNTIDIDGLECIDSIGFPATARILSCGLAAFKEHYYPYVLQLFLRVYHLMFFI